MELINKKDALHAVLHNSGQAAVAAVENIEAVDAVPVVHGEWTRGDKLAWQIEHYICSVCSAISWGKKRNYCPNCGAKMDGKENDA